MATAFRGNTYRHSVALNRWIARTRKEQALEPDLPIIDPHHHLWDDNRGPYLLPDILGDIGGGHNVKATVFIECRTHYRAGTSDAERPLGGMYESNFPVDKQSCEYSACWNAFKRVSAGASTAEKAALFHDTAARVYRTAEAG
jgi:predicted TIM-barrel fold metal-dependent hydrolase